MFVEKNVPQKLRPVIERWNNLQKRYYLGPENLFKYDTHIIKYHGGENIPRSGWCAGNGKSADDYMLTKEDVEEIQHELLKYYKPDRWTIILDWRCNYQCPMCPYHGEGWKIGDEPLSVNKDSRKQIMSIEDASVLIDQLDSHGIKKLTLMSDGEFLLYPYWREVSEYAHKKGMDLWTITNGSLWTEETCREFAELGYTNIRVSLDALSFDTYAKIRSGRKDYYDNAIKLPENLMKYGITTNVHFVKQKENLHEVERFLEYWKEKKVNSISIANEFYYEQDKVKNKLENTKKEYLGGVCQAFGNMETLANGNTVYCCGMDAVSGSMDRDDESANNKFLKDCYNDLVSDAIFQMRDEYSQLRNLCHNCALYVPYHDEKIVDQWKVTITSERETWMRI